MPSVPNNPSIDIFISHSHWDVEIAKRLITLLRAAMSIEPDRIRCSSVPGHQLSGGAWIDREVRKEILSTPVFIALLTRESLKSTYVLLELGARWGFGVHSDTDFTLIPLLAAGMNVNELRDPLRGLSVHSCDEEPGLQQLVEEVSSKLNLPLRKPSHYESERGELKKQSQGHIPQVPIPPPKPVAPKEIYSQTYAQRERMKRELRDELRYNNRKWAPKRVKTLADRARISEDEALKLLESMPDMIVSTTPEGYRIVKKR